jgi:hypothetical protein
MAQIAQEVRRVLSKNPKAIELGHFLLKFSSEKPKSVDSYENDPEAAVAMSKSMWGAFMGAATKLGKGLMGTMKGPKE